ncbi:type II secretion system protein GspL [Vibrio sp. UCD-FRSSP16_10]|uniref:type II secretion system protein GspL n=1 Tax=unclassified Vibrio TaxID=2614977 RepID=UPI000800D17E|nr:MULTISPECIES: type II secretion system protein GspL [unclassified Vibrio]OBT10140.1 type II secretion system protein GspL [Vibrio sp. UCD-FRSSP16_30]OBT18930.1 type II secretion system protein GspL [Vibrio sp. UCD-FRSSP16_10]
MSEILTVRLSRQNLNTVPWLVWSSTEDEIIASGELNSLDELGELTTYATERNVALLLDGQDVALKEVQVPAGATRQFSTMLPFLVEEEVAQDIDELHFSIFKLVGDKAWIAAVDKSYLKQCVARFAEAGIELHKVLPDVLSLPLEEEGITVLPWNGNYLIRHHQFQGMTLSENLLALSITQEPFVLAKSESDESDEEVEVEPVNIRCFGALPDSLREKVTSPIEELPAELPMALLAKNAQLSTISLLSGEFKRQSSWLKNIKFWRAPAIAALVLLVVFSINTYTQVSQMEMTAKSYRAESERIFRAVFPDKRRIPTVSYLKRQMNDEKTRLSGGSVEAPLLTWLIEVQASLKDSSKVKILSMKYDGEREELRIQAQASDFQTFEQLRVAFAKKFSVEQGQINRNGDLVSSSYILKVK